MGGLEERGDGAQAGRGGEVVEQGKKEQEDGEEDAPPPQARGRDPRWRHGSPASGSARRWSESSVPCLGLKNRLRPSK
jgi:hypothetical protein